ncbi:sugar ABC transporter substrate-binding protein [Sinanaerobacter chloroacetimidivorans]|uniref:Substrate-binding domain-containing protein n=1 Tax=Sinanaerobacter chloroacetimidivorans TaxID=2818044 RepID=A0A8J7W2G2_9FIRM|nr:substrate-binding domain-containing protein [Sinanaerobacter chloroacetimidivorans]MBR0599667.1 substrate-binding domain-containing protein [Sinanaerobacter chloroacetimidivorans]
MKKLLMLAVTGLLVLSMAACNGTPSSTGTDEESGPAGKKVSLLTPYLSSVTTNQMVEEMKAGMEEQGMVVTVVDTKGDFAQLASRIEDTVSAKADAIVLVSADPSQVATQLQSAFDAGIPVFGCDSGFVDGMMVNATSDNAAMGELITKYLFDDLMGGKGTVIALTHRPHPGVAKRCTAFDDILKNYPNIKLITEQHIEVPGPIENSRKVMENLILSNSAKDSITAVWCAWDEPAIGATQALQDAGRGEVIVVGVDGNSQAVEMINQGTNLKATVAQNFEGMATIVVTEMTKMFNGEEITKGEQYAPASIITKE